MERIKRETQEQKELQLLIKQMDEYQAELVLSFVTHLFGLDDDAEEARKAA